MSKGLNTREDKAEMFNGCQKQQPFRDPRHSIGLQTPDDVHGQTGEQRKMWKNKIYPGNEQTEIPCTIAEGVKKAMLYVYDMSGKQISEYPVAERGKTSVSIEGGSLDAGMYLYSLIADGNVIDTKRMILTK